MTAIRPDATQMLGEIQTLIGLIRNDDQPETRKQNLDRMERIADMLSNSIEEVEITNPEMRPGIPSKFSLLYHEREKPVNEG